MNAAVVVGVDGSADSLAALDFAADEAYLRRRRLAIVHAYPVRLAAPMHRVPAQAVVTDHHAATERMLADAATRVTDRVPDLDVRTELIDAYTTGGVLIDKSREAELLVLGRRGRGGFAGLLLGSTSTQVAMYAACPVVVIRPTSDAGPHPGAVVVGVDHHNAATPALRFAFEEAALRDVPLIAVHATPAEPGEADSRAFTEAIADWRKRHPDVTVEPKLDKGPPRQVLLDRSAGAALLVVGTRGRGGFAGLLLGSTSQAVLHHATTPVAVVGDERAGS